MDNTSFAKGPDEKIGQGLSKKKCIACREKIEEGARLCPHCHTAQTWSRWRKIGDVIKWAGGITAVVSLVVGMVQLTGLLQTARERQRTVDELTRAAAMLKESGYYERSWDMLEEAITLEPGSPEARKQQTLLAMHWLRNMTINKGQTFKELTDKLLPALYRGSGSPDRKFASSSLAHAGEAFRVMCLDMKEGCCPFNADEPFQKALQLDLLNAYANAMYASWIIDWRNCTKYSEDKFEKVKNLFNAALRSGNERAFVRERQQWVYSSNEPAYRLEYIRLIKDMMEQKEFVNEELRAEAWKIYRLILEDYDESFVQLRQALDQTFSPEKTLDIIHFITSNPGELNTFEKMELQFIMAYYLERKGDLQEALARISSLDEKVFSDAAYEYRRYAGSMNRLHTLKERVEKERARLSALIIREVEPQ